MGSVRPAWPRPELGEAFGELHDAELRVRFESVDQVGDDHFEAHEIFRPGFDRPIVHALSDVDEQFVGVDFEGDVDGSVVVGVGKEKREGFVDGKAKIVDCAHRESFAASDRRDGDSHEPDKTDGGRNRQGDDVGIDNFCSVLFHCCGHLLSVPVARALAFDTRTVFA